MNIFKTILSVGMLGLSAACTTIPTQGTSQSSRFAGTCEESTTATMEIYLPGRIGNVPELFCKDVNNNSVALDGDRFLSNPAVYVGTLAELFSQEYISDIRSSTDSFRADQRVLLAQYSGSKATQGSRNNEAAIGFLAGVITTAIILNNNNRRDGHGRHNGRGHRNNNHHMNSWTRRISDYDWCRNRGNSAHYCSNHDRH